MATNTINVNANDMTKKMTMNVRMVGVKTFRARVLIGIQLIKLAAIIIGCGIEVEPNVDDRRNKNKRK